METSILHEITLALHQAGEMRASRVHEQLARRCGEQGQAQVAGKGSALAVGDDGTTGH